MKTEEELKIEEEAYRKEYIKYLSACSRAGEGFSIDDFPLVKARREALDNQSKNNIAAVKKAIEKRDPVDIWLENSLREDREKFFIKNDAVDSWLENSLHEDQTYLKQSNKVIDAWVVS